MKSPLAVLACGNISRGDDALGPRLLERVVAANFPGVVTIEDFQFQIEHALDLDQTELALFLDAATGDVPPVAFCEVHAGAGGASTHALEPAQLLAVYATAMAKPPPPAFMLTVRGENFDLREEMTAAACERLELAWPFLRDLCAHPDAQRWRGLVPGFKLGA
jgi:hydrogenase maturation protease